MVPVIPLFKNFKIEKSGPVTVTHKRYYKVFMTIPEAIQLILQRFTCAAERWRKSLY